MDKRLSKPTDFSIIDNINKKGIIVWRQFNPDYKVRASVMDIVRNIPNK